MTFDLALWKWSERVKKRPRPGVVYLLLDERSPRALARLDTDRYRAEITRAFPEERFELEVGAKFIRLGFPHGATEVDWFLELARREGLFVFNPQEEGAITEADEAEVEAMQSKWSPSNARFLQKQAEAGDASAMNELGVLHSFGEGVKVDPVEAARWFGLAAAKGHRGAQRNLADCHREGAGVAHDPERAIALMRSLVEGDPCQPAFELAEWFAAGSGIPRDLEKAMTYFQLAREHDHPSAAECMRELRVQLGLREWPIIGRTEHPAVIRTDFSSTTSTAWSRIKELVRAPVGAERFRARVTWLEERDFQGLAREDLSNAVSDEYDHSFLVLVDRQAMRNPGHPLLVIAWSRGAGRELRAAAGTLQGIENNLSIANMDFDELADAAEAAPGKIFRGF